MTRGKINMYCRVCRSGRLVKFFDLGRQPFANSLLKSAVQKEKKYPLSLSWCANCNLVQLGYTADPKELFSHYVWVTGTSGVARKFADFFCDELTRRSCDLKNGYVLEVASNDGTFLKPFIKKGYRVLGVDPAENIVKMAVKSGIPTVCDFFGVKSAKKILLKHGPAYAIFARNVLPHVADTRDFVNGLQTILHDNGTLAIEVHYAKQILEELHYDSIYHEHLCYFTFKNLEKLLNNFGLFVFDIRKSPISGGSIVVYAKKHIAREMPVVQEYRNREARDRINNFSSWKNFARRSFIHREQLLKILSGIIRNRKKIVGYGASARSSTLLNFCKIDSSIISAIADQNPLKQNLFTAGSHIPIKKPSIVMKTNPDYILILAWNFANEIIENLEKRFNYSGSYIIALPNKPRII